MNNQVFNTKGAEIEIQAFHPGEFLLEEIEEREILKKDLAQALEILPNNLSLLFAGKRNISAQLALKIGKFLGIYRTIKNSHFEKRRSIQFLRKEWTNWKCYFGI